VRSRNRPRYGGTGILLRSRGTRGAMLRKMTAFSAIFALSLGGCVQTSDLYAVRQWAGPETHQPDDRPRLNLKELEAKASFAQFVRDECINSVLDTKHNSFSQNPWAAQNAAAAVCVQRIAAYATDQCILISRRQNVVAADVNLALGAVTLGTGGAALYDAIKGPTAKDSEGLLASAATASNTSRAFLPTAVSVKVGDMLTNALLYAEATGLTDDDLNQAKSYKPLDDHGPRSKAERATMIQRQNDQQDENKADAPGDGAMVKFARIHDAVFAACGANAYGVVPAAKPFK